MKTFCWLDEIKTYNSSTLLELELFWDDPVATGY